MSNELQVSYGVSGLTVTAKVFNAAGTQQGSNVSCSEQNSSGLYSGNMPGATAYGVYRVEFYKGAETVASAVGNIIWDGSSEVTLERLLAFWCAERTIDESTGRETVTHAETDETLAQFDYTNASGSAPSELDNAANPINRTPV